MGVVVGFDSSSSINSSDETLGCESLPLSCICSIGDEVPRFHYVACDEESSHNHVRLIGNQCPTYCYASIEVHQAHLISVIITLQIND